MVINCIFLKKSADLIDSQGPGQGQGPDPQGPGQGQELEICP